MKKLLVVEDAFEIRGRGLVVVPGPLETEASANRELDAELRYPDGSYRMVRVRLQHVFQTPPPREPRLGVILPFLHKVDAPAGTSVWCIDEPVSADALAEELAATAFNEPWHRVSSSEGAALNAELSRELVAGHPLHNRAIRSFARRSDSDEVLFLVESPTAALVVVHLAWQSVTDPQWPRATLFASVQDWISRSVLCDARIFEAVAADDLRLVQSLVDEGADVNVRDPRSPFFDGATPLIVAAEGGRIAMTTLLLKLGADVNAQSASGWTALMRACNAGEFETARILLEGGADATLVNDEGYTARGRIPGDNAALLDLLARWHEGPPRGEHP